MTLPSSGAISLNDIHVEAGGTTGTVVSINDADIRALISAGSGSEMSFTDWYGASSAVVDIQNGALADSRLSGTSSCSITFHTDGTISTTGNSTTYSDTNWYSPTTTNIGNNYKLRVTVTGDNPTGPSLGTYHNLTSDLTWTLSQTGFGSKDNTLSLSLATVSPDAEVDTATITMDVFVGTPP